MQVEFMWQAMQLAVENVRSGNGGPFAAVIVRDGSVVATGVNSVTATNDPTAHAEVMAIRAACRELNCFQLTGCEIYTSCEPCPMCLGAIYWARPKCVYYAATATDAAAAGFDDSHIYEQFQVPHTQRDIPLLHIPGADATLPFRTWLAHASRHPY